MFKKTKDLISKGKTKISALVLTLGGFLVGSSAFAAVDPDVASTSSLVVDTMKDNVTGVILTNIDKIVIVGVIIFSIGFVWKLSRRFMR